jgi:hydrogenase maturation protease
VKVLVAGIGNVFFGDDGFGPAVADALRAHALPDGVAVIDFGIRGMDLAFALVGELDAAILVDAIARGGPPGTLYLIEPAVENSPIGIETHAMDPARVLRFAAMLGSTPAFVRVVGCEPARFEADDAELAMGLSAAVAGAVAPAAAMVGELVARLAETTCTS